METSYLGLEAGCTFGKTYFKQVQEDQRSPDDHDAGTFCQGFATQRIRLGTYSDMKRGDSTSLY